MTDKEKRRKILDLLTEWSQCLGEYDLEGEIISESEKERRVQRLVEIEQEMDKQSQADSVEVEVGAGFCLYCQGYFCTCPGFSSFLVDVGDS